MRFRLRDSAPTFIALVLLGCAEPPPPPLTPPTEVSVVKVEPADTPLTIEFVGRTASSRRVEIRARVDGFLDARKYEEGSMVQAGDVLFEMDPKPFEAQLQAAQAELAQQVARLENADAQLNRIRPLAEKNAVAQKELDDAIGMQRSAAASVEAARAKVVHAQLELGYCTIASPVTGLASSADQQEGAYIGITDSLLTYVAQLEPMWVEFSISENQILRGRQSEARGFIAWPEDEALDVQMVLADGTVYPHTGHITFQDASLSEETGTFLLRAEIANPDLLLRPGQFVRVRLLGAFRPDGIVVPQRAVQQGAKGSFVWTIVDGKAKFTPVDVSEWVGDDGWFVDDGLEGGETLVVDGAARLRADLDVNTVPWSDPRQNEERE